MHMVWFEWRDDAPAEEISAIGAALTSLKGRIPGVVDVSCEFVSHGVVNLLLSPLSFGIVSVGRNVTQRAPHTHALLVLLERPEDLAVYADHPLHQDVLRLILPLKKTVNAVDYDVPSSPSLPAAAPTYTLVVGTRNYSSWSMRPWLVLKHMAGPVNFSESAHRGRRHVVCAISI